MRNRCEGVWQITRASEYHLGGRQLLFFRLIQINAPTESRASAANQCRLPFAIVIVIVGAPHEEEDMPHVQYFIERLKAHNDAWMVNFDNEEYGPYKSQSEAVRFAIETGEKRNEHGEGPGRDYRTHVDLRPGHQPRVVVSLAPTANSRACLVPPSWRGARPMCLQTIEFPLRVACHRVPSCSVSPLRLR
jgi:hypothetical protein